ncbi:MAG: hypothetical protein P8M73_09550 [Luminiphilus sp.]|nr:hypothetical protein [Luminiphilus sp.]
MFKFLFRLTLSLLLLAGAHLSQAQDLDCSSSVSLNGGTIEVEADASGDDTENIQCALDAATEGGYRDVFLTSPDYSIGAIAVTGFVGDLRGRSKANTTVTIQDSSLSCDGAIGIALEFQVGTASVRNMTLSVDSPCGDGGSASVIAYYSNSQQCDKRTTFGNVDRVVINGTGTSGLDAVTGVLMEAAPGCSADNERILGTLKVNRSDMAQLDFGVISSVAGGGQVDVNYNTFDEVGLPLTIIDAAQSTTVLSNTFNFNDVPGYPAGTGLGTTAVFIASTSESPSSNSTTLKSNKFKDAGASSAGYGILTGQQGSSIAHTMLVSANTFTGNSASTDGAGLAAIDTNDGLASGNRFSGKAGTWVDLRSGATADGYVGGSVSGWAIVANDFGASQATTDILLGARTSGVVVGKSQDLPIVDDQTGNNDVLEGSSGSSTPAWGNARGSQGADTRSRFEQQLNTLMDIRKRR